MQIDFSTATTTALACIITAIIAFAPHIKHRGWLVALSVILLAVTIYRIDGRSAWEKFIDSDKPLPVERRQPRRRRTTYFEGETELFKLTRRDYFSCSRAPAPCFIGIPRSTTSDVATDFRYAASHSELCQHGIGREEVVAHTREDLSLACNRFVLNAALVVYPIAGLTGQALRLPAPMEVNAPGSLGRSVRSQWLYLYKCRDVLRGRP